MILPTYNFVYIKAGDGTTGTTGTALESYWTQNFQLIQSLLTTLDTSVSERVKSGDITQLKVQNGIAYYTTDNTNWVSLGPSFANISGSPTDNVALSTLLTNYCTVIQFNSLEKRVATNETNISVITSQTNLNRTDIDSLLNTINTPETGALARISSLELSNDHKISSQTVVQIKEDSPGQLSYSTNGTSWNPVSTSLGLEWGQITGNIDNQSDLKGKFDSLSDAITACTNTLATLSPKFDTLSNNFDAHTTDETNPHKVTKAQVGLGNADDTSDVNKPVSTAQKSYIDDSISSLKNTIKTITLTKAQYEALGENLDSSTMYILSDIDD
jgi:hypothetical protein